MPREYMDFRQLFLEIYDLGKAKVVTILQEMSVQEASPYFHNLHVTLQDRLKTPDDPQLIAGGHLPFFVAENILLNHALAVTVLRELGDHLQELFENHPPFFEKVVEQLLTNEDLREWFITVLEQKPGLMQAFLDIAWKIKSEEKSEGENS